jgi:hypothetical protein
MKINVKAQLFGTTQAQLFGKPQTQICNTFDDRRSA